MKKTITLATLMFIVFGTYAQVTEISGQLRPRFENRHGFKTIFPEGEQAANFISQRSRINFTHSTDEFMVGF